jgi:membrane protease YdiL (CAAX protease family)
MAATGLVLVAVHRLGASGRPALIGYLAAFAGLILGLGLAARLLHGRSPGSLVGPDGVRAADVARGAAAVGLVAAAGLAVLFATAPPMRRTEPAEWAAWLPLALPAVLVQATAEELAFRGYLMQGLAARFRSPAVWWGLPAVLFGLLHWNPAEFGANAWLVVVSAAVAGLVLGDVTARTGSVSLAIGLHFANNAVALLIVSLPSPLAALSLFVYPVDPADAAAMRPLIVLDLAVILAAWALWLALRRGR